MFSYLTLEQRVPADHPLRAIRALTDGVLQSLDGEFDKRYKVTGRSSVAPEYVLRALLLQAFYSIRSERQRHGISRLPDVEGDGPRRKKFKAYPIGYFHIDIAEVRTEQGKLYLFVAIDRTSKFACVQLHERATTRVAAEFLKAVIEAVPYKIHTVLTDNGLHFTTPGNRISAAAEIKLALQQGELFRAHAFEFACAKADIDHRLTKPKHPWTNGQVERMNRTLKDATVKRFYYETHEQLRRHLTDFVAAYNFALKTLKGLTPYEYICSRWTIEPQRFTLNPNHLSLGPYT